MFLSIPFFHGDNCDNEHTKGEKLRPCNHCDHPLAFVWGCQKFTPERGNRLPWHGSAINRISHISSICQCLRRNLPPRRLLGGLCGPLSKGHISRSDRPFPRLAGSGAPACAPRCLRCRLRFLSRAQGPGFVMAPHRCQSPGAGQNFGRGGIASL